MARVGSEKKPDAFLSYARLDDKVSDGYISWLRDQLENQVNAGICCVGRLQTSSGPSSSDQAARPKTRWTKARCAGTSLAGTRRTCPLASIAIASTPARVRRAVQKL
jgi:hypothetical protein